MVTQRVIEIDAEALERGEARYNIVIRPGDVIRIPFNVVGNLYVGGHIARPGTYSLPGEKTLTLRQLIISAGGLDPVAIPERVDLTRRLGKGQEATVRLNMRAIFEGVQPDIFLKSNDTINVGTNAIAGFASVIRNSFRFSYGFGFLLDRNFGSDVLGVAPGTGTGRN
jgi:protein involved in polysaccharide export with SLBB domain